jgi:hypothetical protein
MARSDLDAVACSLAKQICHGVRVPGALKAIDLLHEAVPLRPVSLEIGQNATVFLFRYASFTYMAAFVGDLTKRDRDDFLLPLQPKSGFLPEAGRGRPKLLKMIEDGANEAGQPVSRPLSRPSPTANLAGIWKGEPLCREVRGRQVHPNVNKQCDTRCVHYAGVPWTKYAGRNLYWINLWSFHGLFVVRHWL